MTETDYSQSREQAAIISWAAIHGPGRFLDVGSGDGQTFSNTRALFLAGWDGACVEPSPSEFSRLCELYPQAGQSRGVERVNVAVTPDRDGLVDFYYVAGDHLSSLDADHALRWEVVPERITIAAVRLSDLLDRLLEWPLFYEGFEFVSIDTEGTTLELLAAYARHESWRVVRCVCVEIEGGVESSQLAALCPGWTRLAVTPNNVVLAR